MTLDQFMQDEGVTLAELAIRTGLSTASLSRISKGRQNISLETVRIIGEATGGRVGPPDLAEAYNAAQSANETAAA